MSNDPFENLPDNIRKAMKDMMKRLESIDPEELQKMMESILGPDFLEKMKELMSDQVNFSFSINPMMFDDIERVMNEFAESKKTKINFEDLKEETEAYAEITWLDDTEGQIVIDMPGITDVRQVSWELNDKILNVYATNEDINYTLDVEIPENVKLQNFHAEVKNSIFILPFRR